MDSGSSNPSNHFLCASIKIKKKKNPEEKSKGPPKPQPETIQHGYSHLFLIAL